MARRAGVLAGVTALSYFLAVLNFRAVAAGNYTYTALTDCAIAAVNFTIVQRVAFATSKVELLAYVSGGVSGSLVALWWSLHG